MSMPEGRSGPLAPRTGTAPHCQVADCHLAGLDILLVDDDPAEAGTIAQYLQAAGCQLRLAAGGEAGLGLAAAADPALVVTRFDLPGMDGFALLLTLRRRLPRLPGVVLAGTTEFWPVLPTLFEDGVTRLVRKPVEPGPLLAAVATLACPAARQRDGICRYARAA